MGIYFKILGLLFFIGPIANAMVAETSRINLYQRGESMAGEEFIAMSEGVVDYIATLKRPTDPQLVIRYNCSVKSRRIRPSVHNIGTTNPGYVEVRAVYEMRDCTEITPP